MNLRANFLKVFGFAFLAMFIFSGVAVAQKAGQGGQNAPDPRVIFANQAPFTENELTKFITDYAKARTIGDNEAAVKYLSEEGWEGSRFMYLAAKVGLTHEVLKRGGTKKKSKNPTPRNAAMMAGPRPKRSATPTTTSRNSMTMLVSSSTLASGVAMTAAMQQASPAAI